MKIKSSCLETVAVKRTQYPDISMPEIAFAGRSNVGKSSFINSVLNRRSLARTSNKPGKTRTINFYNVNNEFRLVDLPGYGFANAPKSEIESWARSINEYLCSRENLVEILLLVDIRHEPGKLDKQMYEWIKSNGFSGYVVATKSDKISKGSIDKHLSLIKKSLSIESPGLISCFSSLNKYNIEKIHSLVEEILDYDRSE